MGWGPVAGAAACWLGSVAARREAEAERSVAGWGGAAWLLGDDATAEVVLTVLTVVEVAPPVLLT